MDPGSSATRTAQANGLYASSSSVDVEVASTVRSPSILFEDLARGVARPAQVPPAFFVDLNLDQVLATMLAGRDEYDLTPFFHAPSRDVSGVHYRQQALRDLETTVIREAVEAFAGAMRDMRDQIAQAEKLRYKYQKEQWFLCAVETYCDAVTALTQALGAADVASRAFRALRDYLAEYTASERFTALVSETHALKADLAKISYCVHISGNRVTVSPYDGESDYTADVEQIFAKFRQGTAKDYRVRLSDWVEMNHVEAQVLGLVAKLNAGTFMRLDAYYARHRDHLDPTIGAFDREVQFYLAYLEHTERFRSAGLSFCYPEVSASPKQLFARDAFDLALAGKLVPEHATVVCNDFQLEYPERILVVTGPNQGGKTTFARMFGQLHYLASLGFPVPGTKAQLHLPDQLFTHFERHEDLGTLRGKLEDELVRVHDTLQSATAHSILILNESFTSTTLSDALFLGTEVLSKIIALDALCVYVTFIDELASLSGTTVSVVGTVVPDDPTSRTFKIVRMPANGLAYAAALAEKYGLAYESLRRRVIR